MKSETEGGNIDARSVAWAQEYLRSLSLHEQPDEDIQAAWERFYSLCDRFIRTISAAQGVPAADLDDCAQEVWASLVQRLQTLQFDPERGKFHTWLFAIVRNTVVDSWRRESRRRTVDITMHSSVLSADDGADPAVQFERDDEKYAVDQAMAALKNGVSEVNYELAQMRWREERSVSETAEALNLTTRQVWFRQHRMKKQLACFLKDFLTA